MTNHLNLLLSPSDKEQLAIFMQSKANRYEDILMPSIQELFRKADISLA